MKNFSKIIALLLVALNTSAALALPPQVEADRQMLAAQSAVKEQRWDDAVAAYEAVEATGIKTRPAHFKYLYGNALVQAGQYDKGKQQLEAYISSAGVGAKYYQSALMALNAIEEGKKRLAEDQAIEAAREAQNAKIQAAWKNIKTSLVELPPSGEDNCANITLRIKHFANSARNIKCDCQQGRSTHPAFRGDPEEICEVDWQGNPILDGKPYYLFGESGLEFEHHNSNMSQQSHMTTREY